MVRRRSRDAQPQPRAGRRDPGGVVNGATTTGIDGVLSLGAHVTGIVTDTDDLPLEHVCAGALANSDPASVANTAGDGTYDLLAPPGTFIIGVLRLFGIRPRHPVLGSCRVGHGRRHRLTVTAGSTTPGIDAAMTHGGHVVGTVTDATTHDPIENVCIRSGTTRRTRAAEPTALGSTTLAPSLPGIYQVSFVDCAEHPTHGGTDALRCARDQRREDRRSTSSSARRRPARSPATSRRNSGRRSRARASRCSAVSPASRASRARPGPMARTRSTARQRLVLRGLLRLQRRQPERADARPRAPGNDLPRAVVLERVARLQPRSLWRRARRSRSGPTRRPSSTNASTAATTRSGSPGRAGNHTVTLDFLSTVPGTPVAQGLAATQMRGGSGRDAVPNTRHVHVV